MEDAAQKALNKAKIQLMSRPESAFFTTVCFSLKHVWDDTIPTACTNGTEIRYNPEFFMAQSVEQQVGLLLHETLHVAFGHMLRLKDRKPERWNYAADYVINYLLIDQKFKLPEGGLYDAQYAEMSTEQVYDLLPNPPEDFNMDLREPGDGSETAVEETKSQIDEILVRAQLQSQMQGDDPGSIPGQLQRYIDSLLKPKLPWNRILQKYMKALAKNDYTFRRPNRRFFPEHYLPSLHSEGLMNIAIAIDASGSVSDEQFTQFVSECDHMLRFLKPEQMTLIQFDTHIRSVDRITNSRELAKIEFTGKGGTRIEPILNWAEDNKPNVILIFTDGKFRNYHSDPKVPIIWVINDNKGFACAYGKIINYET